MSRVLIAGESWVTAATHYKGYDAFTSVTFETGVDPLLDVLLADGHEVDHLPAHEVPARFPASIEQLRNYDVVILSDIGANSILLHPSTWVDARPYPNRLRVLADWVTEAGGGLAMAGGYLSFQGFQGKGFFRGSAVERVLPAVMEVGDDRVEEPQGVRAELIDATHPITEGISGQWPPLLGYNRFGLTPDSVLLARIGDDPLLAVRNVGAGRSLAWASDIAPHWCPTEFSKWEGYATIFTRGVDWLAGKL